MSLHVLKWLNFSKVSITDNYYGGAMTTGFSFSENYETRNLSCSISFISVVFLSVDLVAELFLVVSCFLDLVQARLELKIQVKK
jgi:hypothetical protein